MNGLPYYKAYPRDFIEGTIGMPFEIKCAYRVVIDLIYMQGGKLPDDARYISGLLGCSLRKWSSLREALVGAGKLQVSDGFLSNYRADKEIETLAKLQDIQRQNASGPRKNKGLQKPSHRQPEPEPEYTKANALDGDAVDFAKAIFDRGVKFLCAHGVKETQARSVIGKWRKDYQDPEIFEAFAACAKSGAIDPIPWISAKLTPAPVFTPQFDLSKFEGTA